MSHRIEEASWKHRLTVLSPFGLGQQKPQHFRDMLGVVWKNRDNLPYAWKVLSRGVCDGCALGVAGFHDWTIDGVHLCTTRLNLLRLNTMPAMDHDQLADVQRLKQMDNAQLRELGRLAYPMRRRRGEPGFTRISWDDAYASLGQRIRAASSPDRLAFFMTSRAITNEVYYVAQKVVRWLGTNNIDNAARLCHSPSTAAMKTGIGVAATTCSYKDWYGTDLLVFFGSNPANDQPVTTKYLHGVKKEGTRVVMVNPYLEPGMKRYWVPSTASSAVFGTKIADDWFPVSKGGDIAFLYGVIRTLIEEGWCDTNFIEQHTADFDALAEKVRELSWEELEKQAGLPRASMREFAELVRDAKNAVLVWSMGITQHRFGGDGVQMIVNLGLLRGYVGRDKNGLMPIRGHSGVQGGAEMGAYATAFPGGKPINAENAAQLAEQYGFDVPDRPGITSANMVEAAHRNELDLLYCAGGNFLRTLPDPDYVAKAMANVPLRVHQDIILTDQMLIDPTHEQGEVLLLPARTRYEQEDGGTQTSTERRVMFSPQIPRTVGEAKSEWKIWLELAEAVDAERAKQLGCATGKAIRDEIARVVPIYDGIQHLKKTGDAFQYGGPHLCADGNFPTPDGKAHFRPVPLPKQQRRKGWFDLSTRRGKQFNTLIYAEVDPLNGAPRDAVLMNSDDAARLHLKHRDRVVLVNEHGRYDASVFLAPIAPGNLQAHWPESNGLIPHGVLDEAGGVPDYNAQVRVERVEGAGV
ncbi:MAG: FdhF/YdeP family oxidoreductase [Phycisphaeraceae bacterium]